MNEKSSDPAAKETMVHTASQQGKIKGMLDPVDVVVIFRFFPT
jgi:hypothetical protein